MEKVAFGLIGYGAWGSHHARVLAESARASLVAIADADEGRRHEARQQHPHAHVTADYRELLARSDIEAVSVVLPSHLHSEVSTAALDAGKHLFLEKPMALSVADCRALNDLARAKNLRLGITHQFRFSSLWAKVKQLIDAGSIGDPHYALIELWRNPYRPGVDGWRHDPRRVGDWILEEPIHFFDLARWYFSAYGEPVSVYARANSLDLKRPTLQDNFSATLNFAGGRYAVISQTLGAFEHHQVAKITGTRGAIWASWCGAMDRTFSPSFFLKQFDGRPETKILHDVPIVRAAGEVFELADAINDMADVIRSGGRPGVTGEDGLASVAMCLKAQESVASGGVVAL